MLRAGRGARACLGRGIQSVYGHLPASGGVHGAQPCGVASATLQYDDDVTVRTAPLAGARAIEGTGAGKRRA